MVTGIYDVPAAARSTAETYADDCDDPATAEDFGVRRSVPSSAGGGGAPAPQPFAERLGQIAVRMSTCRWSRLWSVLGDWAALDMGVSQDGLLLQRPGGEVTARNAQPAVEMLCEPPPRAELRGDCVETDGLAPAVVSTLRFETGR